MNVSERGLNQVVFSFITVDELDMHPRWVVEALILHLFTLEFNPRLDELRVHTGQHSCHSKVSAHANTIYRVGLNLNFVNVFKPVTL